MDSSSRPKTILIVHNPRAGARSSVPWIQRLAGCLESDHWNTRLVGDLTELTDCSAELGKQGDLRAVVIAGGDGTVAAVANRTPVGTPLIVFPSGTENLVAKYFRYRRRPEDVARLLEDGVEIAIDAGQANEKLFVLMIGAGFDAEVVRQVAERRSGHIRRWTYAKPLLQAMRTYRYPQLRIQWRSGGEKNPLVSGAESHTATIRWAFGMNLSKYAFGLNFAPAAVGNDGLLDVCTFSEGSAMHVFRYAWGVFSQTHLNFRDFRMIRCQEMRIEGPAGSQVPYQLDGDFGGYLPVDVRVLPGRLRFLVPAVTANRLVAAWRLQSPTHLSVAR